MRWRLAHQGGGLFSTIDLTLDPDQLERFDDLRGVDDARFAAWRGSGGELTLLDYLRAR